MNIKYKIFIMTTISLSINIIGQIIDTIPFSVGSITLVFSFTLLGILCGWIIFTPRHKAKEILK